VLLLRVPSSSSPAKGLYNPKAFITHAASLDQGCPHCPRFPTAASRRSLGRVSVPVWLTILSDQLPITGLVGLYPTNYLIGRGPIPGRLSFGHDPLGSRRRPVLAAVSRGCPGARGRYPRVTHPFATRTAPEGTIPVRLACVRRAASVRSEPGSNSQLHPRPGQDLPVAHRRRTNDDRTRPGRPSRGPYGITRALPPLRPLLAQVSENLKGRPVPRPTRPQPDTKRQTATRPDPETRLNPRCARPTAPQPPPTHPFLTPHCPKNGRGPESRALANETDPIGAPSLRSQIPSRHPAGGRAGRLCSPAAVPDQAPFATSSRIAVTIRA
jgi:hypothetical protein